MQIGDIVKWKGHPFPRKGLYEGCIGIIIGQCAGVNRKFWRVAFENREINVHQEEVEVIA